MKLSELFCDYKGEDVIFNNLSINTKTLKKGDIFLCIKGINVDRHDYINEAIYKGCVAVITQKEVDIDIPYHIVKDLDKKLSDIYAKFYNYPQNKLKIIGITGTDGKTSTTTIIQSLIGKDLCGYIGTNGYSCAQFERKTNNTTPGIDELYKILNEFVEAGCQYVALEASSEGFYYERLKNINFIIGGLTNIDCEHLNTHKTLENYIECKKQLFKQANISILNSNDKYYLDFKNEFKNHLSYGYKKEDDFYIKDYKIYPNKTDITFIYKNEEYNITSSLLGRFNIENLALSMITCLNLGFKIEYLLNNIKNINIKGRMQIIDHNQNYHIIVDFAHTPNGLNKIFEFVKSLNINHIISVMGQPGGRDAYKRKTVGKILTDNSDIVIFTADDPRYENVSDIIDMMLEDVNKDNYYRINDRSLAIIKALNIAKENDLVLILGKGEDDFIKIEDKNVPYSDIDVINNYFKNAN